MKLTFDRSVRHFDDFGRLHVSISNICMATVSPYYGREVPDWEALGLEPDRIYQVFRPPEELAKAYMTSNNIQILSTHVPVHADDPQKDLVVGSTGTDATWNDPYITNSLVFTDAEAIRDIESRDKVELSPCYAYVAVRQDGTHKGQSYELVMTQISFNHVAQVESGRQGPSVTVADSKGPILMAGKLTSRTALMVHGALIALVSPRLAADAKVDLSGALAGVTAKNIGKQSPAIVSAVEKATKGKLAADASLSDLAPFLAKLAADADPDDKDDDLGEDEEDDDKNKPAADAEEDDDKNKPAADAEEDDKPPSKAAMDAAIAAAGRNAVAQVNAIRQAERDVFPVIGELKGAADSAGSIYKLALDHLGVDYKGVHESAFPALLKMAQDHAAASPAREPKPLAADAAAVAAYHDGIGKQAARFRQL